MRSHVPHAARGIPPGRPPASPDLRVEKRLLRALGPDAGGLLVGMDEVGRGALAGPVTVGAVLIDLSVRRVPAGLRDSKLLTPAERTRLVPRIRAWARCWGVGSASAVEIDQVGILCALRLAGERALGQLADCPDVVLLDGNYDYLNRPQLPATLFDPPAADLAAARLPVTTRIKADLGCAAVAAASVLAKTARDALMVAMSADHPEYGWEDNKGYSAPAHSTALRRHGPCVQHRRSWRLPVDGWAGWTGLTAAAQPSSDQLEVLFDAEPMLMPEREQAPMPERLPEREPAPEAEPRHRPSGGVRDNDGAGTLRHRSAPAGHSGRRSPVDTGERGR